MLRADGKAAGQDCRVLYGIPKAPLSVGLGASYSPELRVVESAVSATPSTTTTSAWRIGIVAGLDIPLFP